MESIRRCEDCRRIVRGAAGDACPYCGGGRLVIDIPPPAPTLKHPAVLTLVLTYSIGLVLLRTILVAVGWRQLAISPAMGELFWQLQFTGVASTALYLILRRSEGDFRALLLV